MRRILLLVFLWAVASATVHSVSAATQIDGQNAGGAYYRIIVPDNWNHELVIWNHGFSLSDPDPDVDIRMRPRNAN